MDIEKIKQAIEQELSNLDLEIDNLQARVECAENTREPLYRLLDMIARGKIEGSKF